MKDTLFDLLRLDPARQPVTSIVGAGGKTTLLYLLARQASRRGLRTAVTTSTHIFRPQDGDLDVIADPSAGELIQKLYGGRVVVAGKPCAMGKLAYPGDEVYRIISEEAQAVFIEADGSKHLPLKFPAAHEPVILPGAGRVLAVMGIGALGLPFGQVCHRAYLAWEVLSIPPDRLTGPREIALLLLGGYRHLSPTVLLNQADTPGQRRAAEEIAGLLVENGMADVHILSLRDDC